MPPIGSARAGKLALAPWERSCPVANELDLKELAMVVLRHLTTATVVYTCILLQLCSCHHRILLTDNYRAPTFVAKYDVPVA